MQACLNCGKESEDGFAFCPHCAAPLTTDREQRKTVTVLFCDVVGSTALGEAVDAEAARLLLARFFDRMKGIIEAHGGVVDKFIGDAVMAIFGVPVVHEDDALRALRAASEMQEALPELGLQARIGVNTGEVVTGTAERLVTGDAVNVAARLEQAAETGTVLLGAGTLQIVRDVVDVSPVGPLELKGKAEPVTAWQLLAVRRTPERRSTARMVGRERELARLRAALGQAAQDRSCQLFTILGNAGVGKSRLVAEFLTGLEARVVRGHCLSYGEGITYGPVVGVIKQLDRLPAGDAAATAIRSLLGESETGTSADVIAWAFRKLLEHEAQQQPLVVVFDDLHWGEGAFLDLVENIADLARDAPILLLCMSRPELLELRPSWGGGKWNATTALLEPLDDAESARLLDELGGVQGTGLERNARERICAAAEGNPLFLEEMLALVRESDGGELALPPTIQALLAARLDQLEPAERSVLERGAVEGRLFHPNAVQALGDGDLDLPAQLVSLVRKDLIRPGGGQLPGKDDAYLFRHQLIRDAAYDALPKAVRAELHERFAGWLSENGPDLVELDEILGYHLEQASRYRMELAPGDEYALRLARNAAERLAFAGRRAVSREDTPAAAAFLSRAAELLPRNDSGRLELLAELGEALRSYGRLAEVSAVLDEVIDGARAADDPRLEWRAILERSFVKRATDPQVWMEEIREEVEQAIEACEKLRYEQGQVKAWRLLGSLEVDLGHTALSEQHFDRALVHARRSRDERAERAILGMLGQLAVVGPMRVEEAIGVVEGHSELARSRGQPHWQANCYESLARLYAMRGQFREARSLLASAQSLRTDLGLPVAGGAWDSAEVEMLAGDWAAAEEKYRAAYRFYEENDNVGMTSTVAALVAHALLAQGRSGEALRFAELSEKKAASDDTHTQGLWRAARAKIVTNRGEFEEGKRLAGQAVALEGTTDDLNAHGDALMDLADILGLAGLADEGAAIATQALRLYGQKGNVVSAERARTLLRQLQADHVSA